MVRNIKEETVYEFEIGPFKKAKSKFQEGMLPWLCDLSKEPKVASKYPAYKSVASEYISDVSYAIKKKEEGGNQMGAFLTFKLFIPR